MQELSEDPFPKGKPHIKMLRGFRPPLYRLRAGDYRIVYRLSGGTVEILACIHRRDLDREMSRFR